jgi:hypothetical protein
LAAPSDRFFDGRVPIIVAKPLVETDSGLVRVEVKGPPDHQVEIWHTLTNFTARIMTDISRDDGAEVARAFEIVARIGDRSETFTVPAAQFATMRWPTEHMGSRAVVYAGQGTADHARVAIQLLSGTTAARTVFTHTGWRKVGGQCIYLHGDGGIGPSGGIQGVQVDLPPELAYFRFQLSHDPVAAIRTSLKLLDLGPDRITIPVYGAILRAILGGADFSLLLYGATGVFKTELATLVQQHFGADFDSRHLPTSFTSTANTNELLAFTVKDAVLVVDELHPPATGRESETMHRDAARLLRSQGNNTGRGRMRADGTLRPTKPPRGLLLATAEELPRGHSVHARVFTCEIRDGDISREKLTACQQDAAAGLYAGAMAASFIAWLAPRLSDARVEFDRLRHEARAALQYSHPRTSDICAQLTATFSIFIAYLLEAAVVDDTQAARLQARIGSALKQVADAQAHYGAGAEPTAAFLRLLGSALGSGGAHLADRAGAAPDGREQACGWRSKQIGYGANERTEWQSEGPRIGWIDRDDLYLDRDASYRAAQAMAADGSRIEVSPTTLARRLRDRVLLVSIDQARETLTVRHTIEGRQRDVLHIRASALGCSPSPKPDKPDEPPSGHKNRLPL